jgi:hypothetical protein
MDLHKTAKAGAFLSFDITHLPKISVKNYFVLLQVDFAASQSDNFL